MESLVQSQTGIDFTRKFVGLGDDGFQRCPDESITMRLTASQRPGVSAEKRQMRSEFLA
jgi:hypothetical protein